MWHMTVKNQEESIQELTIYKEMIKLIQSIQIAEYRT